MITRKYHLPIAAIGTWFLGLAVIFLLSQIPFSFSCIWTTMIWVAYYDQVRIKKRYRKENN